MEDGFHDLSFVVDISVANRPTFFPSPGADFFLHLVEQWFDGGNFRANCRAIRVRFSRMNGLRCQQDFVRLAVSRGKVGVVAVVVVHVKAPPISFDFEAAGKIFDLSKATKF